jgi:hypothetical protein
VIHVDEQIGVGLVSFVRRGAGEVRIGGRRALVLARPDLRAQRLFAFRQPLLQRLPLLGVERHRRVSCSGFRATLHVARRSPVTAGRIAPYAAPGGAPGRSKRRTFDAA